jgi:uncharacterized ion transporter superfamily protein YfcC
MTKKFPDSIILIFGVMVLVALLTWILPSGNFEREVITYGVDESLTKEIVIPNSYTEVNPNPVGFWDFLMYPLKGIVSASSIIAFILLLGGVFSIINATGAINTGLFRLLEISEKNKLLRTAIIPVLMLVFSICGATFGMAEETLLFVMITIPLAERLGYDKFVGLAIPFLGAGAGFAGAFVNPFTLQIAQGIADLQPLSGTAYRLVVWALFTTAAIAFVMRYASRINRSRDFQATEILGSQEKTMSTAQTFVIIFFVAAIIVLIIGSMKLGWYIEEISALFLLLGLISAAVSKISLDDMVASFISGVKDMVHPALLVGFAKAILLIADEGKIIDTVLFAIANSAGDMPNWINANIMFLVQSGINFVVPSGSGQAALTMPVMTPLADVLGLSRQTAVLAYQFGDGISNLIIPTSGVTMGLLSLSKINYKDWVKWLLPFFITLNILAFVLLAFAELFEVWNWSIF